MDYRSFCRQSLRLVLPITAFFLASVVSATPRAGKNNSSDPEPAGFSTPVHQQPVIFTFGYGGLVDTYVTALYAGNSIYLPVHTLFNDLQLDNHLDIRKGTISGFYIKESDKYTISFDRLTVHVGGKKFTFDSTDFIRGPVDFYVLPAFFRKMFKLDFSLDMNRLTILLKTTLKLPIISSYQRKVNMQYQTQPLGIFRPQAPLEYPRNWSLLNGGVMDYSLGSYYSGSTPSYSYNFLAGGELLGGDIEGTLSGEMVGKQSTIYTKEIHWRYVIDSTRVITSFSVGNLFSNGINQYDFRGVQITNQPVQLRRFFGSYAFDANVQPGWQTELYLNGERVGFAQANAFGRVHYDIPLVYGSSYLQLKTFGPSGQFEELDRRLQIPFNLIPKGEFDYTINAGKLSTSNSNLVQVNASYGLTGWLTEEVGADYLQSPLFNKPVPYNSFTMRIGSPYILTLTAAPSMLYESTLEAVYPSQASVNLTYYHYYKNGLYNPSGELNQLSGTVYLPFPFGTNMLDLDFAGNGQNYYGGSKTLSYSGGVEASVSRFNISFNYTGSYQAYASQSPAIGKTLTAALLYSFFLGNGAFSFVNGTLAGLTADYDLGSNSITTVRLDLSQYIGNAVSAQFSVNGDLLNHDISFNLQLTWDLPFMQASSSTTVQGGQRNSTQFVSGSVGYDSHYGEFLFNRVQWAGQSAVSMRMYLDNNQDGKFDKGDVLIKNGDIVLRQAVSSDLFTSGIIRAWDLLPYTQYSADIQSGSLQNPLWMPVRKSFSFITDPNVYKPIDIPFYTAGVIQGSVKRVVKGRQRAVPGIEVIVEAIHGKYRKTISAFNDGSIYYVGVPPGDYKIYVDPSQVSALGDTSAPMYRDFTVESKKSGDFIKGLSFVLSAPPPPAVVAAREKKAAAIRAMRYMIQLGAFSERDRARLFASELQRRIGRVVHVRYNPKSSLYAVQLDTMKEGEEAYRLEQRLIYDYGIRDAFVMVLPDSNVRYTFSVRLGFFRSLSDAERFASESRAMLGMKTRLGYNSPLRLYEVIVGAFGNETDAQNLLDKVRTFRQFRRAELLFAGRYIVDRYAVLLGEFDNYRSALAFASGLFDRRGIDALIDFDSTTLRFEVYTTPTPYRKTAKSLMNELETLKLFKSMKIISVQ